MKLDSQRRTSELPTTPAGRHGLPGTRVHTRTRWGHSPNARKSDMLVGSDATTSSIPPPLSLQWAFTPSLLLQYSMPHTERLGRGFHLVSGTVAWELCHNRAGPDYMRLVLSLDWP